MTTATFTTASTYTLIEATQTTPHAEISVWLGNLEAYNSGELRGEWLALPASEEEINAMLTRIGCMKDGEVVYEYLVMDWDDYTGMGLASMFGEYCNLGELSEFVERGKSATSKKNWLR